MTDTSTESTTTSEHQPELKRVLGPKLLLLFIVGDILGTGIYAITGSVAKEVGGAVWLPFLVAFVVATMTAFSYLELVTKYPQAAGAALYVHKAFGVHFVTFLVCFTVMCSGITSASTASRAFAANLEALVNVVRADWLGLTEVEVSDGLTTVLAICFIALVASGQPARRGRERLRQHRAHLRRAVRPAAGDLGRDVRHHSGQGRSRRVVMFDTAEDKSIFLAVTAGTTLAFFAMVGFEDSVNMAEEIKDPEKIFPKIMLTGLGITGPDLRPGLHHGDRPGLPGRAGRGRGAADQGRLGRSAQPAGGPDLPADLDVRRGQLGLDQHADGQPAAVRDGEAEGAAAGARPGAAGSADAVGGDPLHHRAGRPGLLIFVGRLSLLGGTTALLLLAVFTVVNITCLVLRKDKKAHQHFVAPTVIPIIGALCCAFLVGPWTGRNPVQYSIAGVLIGIGIVLWLITWLINRAIYARKTYVKDVEDLEGDGPVN